MSMQNAGEPLISDIHISHASNTSALKRGNIPHASNTTCIHCLSAQCKSIRTQSMNIHLTFMNPVNPALQQREIMLTPSCPPHSQSPIPKGVGQRALSFTYMKQFLECVPSMRRHVDRYTHVVRCEETVRAHDTR